MFGLILRIVRAAMIFWGRQREMRLRKLNPPPQFDSNHVNAWVLHVRYWRELYSTIDELQILSAMWLNASDELKDILMDFPDDTKDRMRERTSESFLTCVRREYGAIQELERMDRLGELMMFKRKQDMSIRSFWRQFKRLALYAKKTTS